MTTQADSRSSKFPPVCQKLVDDLDDLARALDEAETGDEHAKLCREEQRLYDEHKDCRDCDEAYRKAKHARRMLEHLEFAEKRRRFVVEVEFPGHGTYIQEVDTRHTTLDAVLTDIMDGQYDRVVAVYELTDVSCEIATRLAHHSQNTWRQVGKGAARFVEQNSVAAPYGEAAE